jgi:hypothetical protein
MEYSWAFRKTLLVVKMIKTEQFFNVFNKQTIDKLVEDYFSKGVYDTNTMNKASPDSSLKLVIDQIEETVGKKLEFVVGNFYRHKIPYLPHTDFKTYQGNILNIVIPLSYSGTLPHLIIFDQWWDLDSVTWCMDNSVKYFTYNIGVKGSPYEYPVKGLMSQEFDENFYKTYLKRFKKETLYGLTANAYPFEPGSIIVFDSRRIHCTADIFAEKIGLTLRFK